MRSRRLVQTVLAALAACFLITAGGFAQSASTDESQRKIKSKTTPAYPDLARRLGVTGKVKIEAVITPDGRVKSTRVIGGHPLLVQACQNALKEWKFAAAPEETAQTVECDFRGTGN
jgi:TonB family protein